ncbi:cation-transporting P-type ATPase PCA1 LALA0_S06e00122g [Lachancea lanzarotensis]|uniref:LALA0S06e00122g1_1 n=1 Tax=Lachancea lanzarotensis TaxID=1245769 RepID=A0A0C7N3U9_9SACH|nr:uncharacterized protein LALA0_S06e00122g [Lachancea lanzarotensis]CEP62631.1 LALA0S06e00122g1_1 [Lachancea lanzarotensis]
MEEVLNLTSTRNSLSDLEEADCCAEKSYPCCTDACVDRLVDRGYTANTGLSPFKDGTGTEFTEGNGKPLRTSIREEYGARLRALGCLCRMLIAKGMESCCESRAHRTSFTKQCRDSVKEKRNRCKDARMDRRLCSKQLSSCTQTSEFKTEKQVKNCNNRDEPNIPTKATGCCAKESSGTKCASRKAVLASNETQEEIVTSARTGAPNSIEHVVISVYGMTCTGCETKLLKTLQRVPTLINLKTSLVLARAEFDLDIEISPVSQVLKHLERTTEFRCEQINLAGMTLEVVVLEKLETFRNRKLPDGVTDMIVVEKNLVRINYDPNVIGARDLLETIWAGIVSLAPLCVDPALKAGKTHTQFIGLMTILSAALTVPILIMAWAPLPDRPVAYGIASLTLATLIQVLVAGPFYPKALKALVFSRVIEMDLLIVLSTSTAYIFSLVSFGFLTAGKPLKTGQFFETSSLLVTLIMVGRYFTALTRQKALESTSIRSLQSNEATLVNSASEFEGRKIDVRLLQRGDIFMVIPDSIIPTDGVVVNGDSDVDESMLTGESVPVEKHLNSRVIAGTMNMSGTLLIRTARLPGENTINEIGAMVDDAKLSKPKIQQIADLVASFFVPVIVTITIITFAIWIVVGIKIQKKNNSDAIVQAISYAITVLVVSCPCAIGLAVPMVIVFASGLAAQRGIIIKSASVIETAHKISHVVFDKTGTLTKGELKVVSEHFSEGVETQLGLLLSLVSNSKHPVSIAVKKHLLEKNLTGSSINNSRTIVGQGIKAEFNGKSLRAGSARWIDIENHDVVRQMQSEGYTTFCFSVGGSVSAIFALEDSLRDDAPDVVARLQRQGVSVHLLSGDDEVPVLCVASKLKIPETNVKAKSSAIDKRLYVEKLLKNHCVDGKANVMFCGDGTNDAIALAQATIGIHLNSASGLAESAADVVLARPTLSSIVSLMNLSKLSMQRIRFNFAWSFIYNLLAILLGAGVFVKARIPPEYAGLGELVSVVPVIVAALLLKWAKI